MIKNNVSAGSTRGSVTFTEGGMRGKNNGSRSQNGLSVVLGRAKSKSDWMSFASQLILHLDISVWLEGASIRIRPMTHKKRRLPPTQPGIYCIWIFFRGVCVPAAQQPNLPKLQGPKNWERVRDKETKEVPLAGLDYTSTNQPISWFHVALVRAQCFRGVPF